MPLVTIGAHTFHDIVAIQAPKTWGAPTPNAIGWQFLSQFFVVVDFANGAITLWPLNSVTQSRTNCGFTRVPMEHTEKDNQLAGSAFETNGGHLRLLWDTGSPNSMLSETIAQKLNIPTYFTGPETQFYQSKMLSAAGQTFRPCGIPGITVKAHWGLEQRLGNNFFDQHVVCLDYARREVWIH